MVDIDKLPKHRKDWLEIWGNTWAPTKTAGVACEACVYGTKHGAVHVCPADVMAASLEKEANMRESKPYEPESKVHIFVKRERGIRVVTV